jgi:glycosyltransferase involved in cell wall biosynthesis
MPRFSVVIPAFNASETIVAAIGSVLAQTARDLEAVVVDDGSTDQTADLVQRLKDPRLRLVRRENGGPAKARNAGIAASRGQYVTFLDSDDLLLPDYLELAGAALAERVRPGFAYTDAYVFYADKRLIARGTAMERQRPPVPPPTDSDAFLLELLRRNFVYTAATVPRTVLDHVGGFDERLIRSEDYQLWLRVVSTGYTPVRIPGLHGVYRLHDGQRSAARETMARGLLAIYESLDMDAMPTQAHRDLLNRRRNDAQQELRLLCGERRVAWMLRQSRHWLGRVRERMGLGQKWWNPPPADVAAAFPDLV